MVNHINNRVLAYQNSEYKKMDKFRTIVSEVSSFPGNSVYCEKLGERFKRDNNPYNVWRDITC